MKEIDWSKAPEGATHHLRDRSGFVQSSFVIEMEDRYQDAESSGYLMKKDLNAGWQLNARPEPWDGEGLPPVGTVCECQNDASLWVKGVIVYVGFDKGTALAIMQADNEMLYGVSGQFRLTRTPEQIAAEEREEGINQLQVDSEIRARDGSRLIAERLWDMGYRKQEQPK